MPLPAYTSNECHVFQQFAGAFAEGGQDVVSRDFLRNHQGNVLRGHRETGDVLRHDDVRGGFEECIRVELKRHRTCRHVMRGEQLGVQFAGVAHDVAGTQCQLGGASRVVRLVAGPG